MTAFPLLSSISASSVQAEISSDAESFNGKLREESQGARRVPASVRYPGASQAQEESPRPTGSPPPLESCAPEPFELAYSPLRAPDARSAVTPGRSSRTQPNSSAPQHPASSARRRITDSAEQRSIGRSTKRTGSKLQDRFKRKSIGVEKHLTRS